MKASHIPIWHRCLASPLALQGLIALGVLAVALSPSRGGAAVYLPLPGGRAEAGIAWTRASGAALLAPGPYAGAVFLRVPDGSFGLRALGRGALVIAVPETLCGASPPRDANTPSPEKTS